LVVVLLLIQPIRGSLPHIDGSIDNGLSGLGVPNVAVHIRHLAIVDAMDDIRFIGELWRIVTEEVISSTSLPGNSVWR
jgi:hypothetical protein